MAFYTPPEVLLRQCLRSCSGLRKGARTILSEVPCSARSFKAAVCTKLRDPLEIQIKPYPTTLKPTQVLIATHACGINFADILTCQGLYQQRPKIPFIPGSEVAGKVVEAGAEVTNLKKGDRVFALGFANMGGCAQVLVAESKSVIPVPDNLDLVTAAGTIISYSTAIMALSCRAKLKKKEKVLVTAAAGATGLAAVDIAKHVFDCQVIAACGGQVKCNFVKEFGADATIDYTCENIRDRVKEITKGHGVNVVMDQVGGDTLIQCVKSLAFEGRALTIGYASGTIPNIPANLMLLKSASLIGVFWGSYAVIKPLDFAESISAVLQAVIAKKIKPYVGKTFPLEQINQAYQYIQDRRSIGKVVLKMREEDDPPEL